MTGRFSILDSHILNGHGQYFFIANETNQDSNGQKMFGHLLNYENNDLRL